MLTVEFLESNGFSPVQYPDGLFYIYEHYIQVSEDLSDISEVFDGYVNDLTQKELLDTITRHNKAINQYVK